MSLRLGEFADLYPEVKLQLLLSDDDLDLGMREADMALRLREPMQPDLIRRRLFTVHFHAYASAEYLKKSGQPRTIADLDQHRLVAFGAPTATHFLYDLNSLLTVGREPKSAHAASRDQQSRRHHPRGRAWRRHRCAAGLLRGAELRAGQAVAAGRHAGNGLFPRLPEEMKSVARMQAFRDFLVAKAQRWRY